MKILLINKFYYPRGGDCIYTIELEKLLQTKGHDVAVFSMQHPENLLSKYSHYFPTEAIFSLSNRKGIVETLLRPFGTQEVKSKFIQLLNNFQPDIVHLNNIHTQLSPIIAEIAYNKGIKVIWTLHDYKLLCPASAFLEIDGTICESCLYTQTDVIRKNCIKGSKFASVLGYFEARKWNNGKLNKYTNTFIAPSKFLKQKMLQGGYIADQIVQLYNFANNEKFEHEVINKRNKVVIYVGRLSIEKGVDVLCHSFQGISNAKLVIIGDGPLKKELEKKYASNNTCFLGFQPWSIIKEKLSKSAFLVIPSQWYENNPLTVIEALALGTPVLGANIGGIPELIQDGVNGMTFPSRDLEQLTIKIQTMLDYNKWDYQQIQSDAKLKFSSDKYYSSIMELYNNVISNGINK